MDKAKCTRTDSFARRLHILLLFVEKSKVRNKSE